MSKPRALCGIAMLLGVLILPITMRAQERIEPIADTYIDRMTESDTYCSAQMLLVGNGASPDVQESLLRWSNENLRVCSTCPSGPFNRESIVSATLYLHEYSGEWDYGGIFRVVRFTGGDWTCCDWTACGGAYDEDTEKTPTSIDPGGWWTFNVTDFVKNHWLYPDGPDYWENHGLAVVDLLPGFGGLVGFHSVDSPDVEKRPYIEIDCDCYAPAHGSTWGRIKAMYE
jgi:hypothetical protein